MPELGMIGLLPTGTAASASSQPPVPPPRVFSKLPPGWAILEPQARAHQYIAFTLSGLPSLLSMAHQALPGSDFLSSLIFFTFSCPVNMSTTS